MTVREQGHNSWRMSRRLSGYHAALQEFKCAASPDTNEPNPQDFPDNALTEEKKFLKNVYFTINSSENTENIDFSWTELQCQRIFPELCYFSIREIY